MKKILILVSKGKKGKTKLERLLNESSTDATYTVTDYDNVEIIIPGHSKGEIIVKVDRVDILDFDFVYFRSWKRWTNITPGLAHFLNKKKVPFIDSLTLDPLFDTKLLQMILLHINGLPVPKTVFVSRESILDSYELLTSELGERFIMKDDDGAQGRNNFLVDSKQKMIESLEEVDVETDFIFQEFIENSFDYRLLVLGNEVKVAEKRIRTDKSSHLNNVSKGSVEEFVPVETVDNKLLVTATKAAKVFKREVAGVDIVEAGNGGHFLFEVNASPGFTYDLSISPEIAELDKFLSNYSELR